MADIKSYITQDDIQRITSGASDGPLADIASKFRQLASPPPTIIQVVVIEVISDPKFIVNDKKKNYWRGVLGVSNMNYADVLPRNTIIAQELGGSSKPQFCFPFFPSHLALPSKAGEVIWAMQQNPTAEFSDLMYWMCKVTQPHFVDDVNHTHMPRIHEPSYVPGTTTKSLNDGKPDAWNELRNGPVQILNIDGKAARTTNVPQQYVVSKKDDIFESIVTETDAGKTTQYEAVPRFRKRPGDLVLEGTNNTLVVLGTDRSGPIAEYSEEDNQLFIENATEEKYKKSLRPKPLEEDLQGSAGSIDLVVGRGQTEKTFGKQISTTRIKDSKDNAKGSELKKELDKVVDLQINEGDPDFLNDRSRILLSQRMKVDQKFGLQNYNKKFKNPEVKDEPNGAAAVVIKSDKIKLMARLDMQIVVVGSKNGESPTGMEIKKDESDLSKWASITIKSNGDIVFTPSSEGVIKLGGDDANLAILCVTSPNASAANGIVQGTPIGNGAGGLNGAGGGTGEWATKVLVK